jgi:DNA-binding NtrC family response regulator
MRRQLAEQLPVIRGELPGVPEARSDVNRILDSIRAGDPPPVGHRHGWPPPNHRAGDVNRILGSIRAGGLPLRDHAEGVPALAAYFLAGSNAEYRRNTRRSPEALKGLQAYRWPGNLRRLRGVLESAVAMSAHDAPEPRDFPLGGEARVGNDGPATLNLEQTKVWIIRKVPRTADGLRTLTAPEPGIHRDTLLSKIKEYGIERDG